MYLRTWMTTFILLVGGVLPAPAQNWELRQNDPNPFCNHPDENGPTTEIGMVVAQACRLTLEVLSPDSSTVIATLADGLFAAGNHVLMWDGTEGPGGADLANGDYPYEMVARDTDDGAELFRDMKVATIACATPSKESTWGKIKALYQ